MGKRIPAAINPLGSVDPFPTWEKPDRRSKAIFKEPNKNSSSGGLYVKRTYVDIPEQFPPGTTRRPFSDAVLIGDTLYTSGRIGVNLQTGELPEDPAVEARLLMDNLRAVLAGAGMTMDDVVQMHVYTTDISLNTLFNEVYFTYFEGNLPARSFIACKQLLLDARFELTAIAIKS